MARECLPLEMALEEWPPVPMETPIANGDQRLESLSREPSAGCSKGREIGERGMEVAVDKVWVGIDAGKEFHWAHVLDSSGRELLSRKLENDEARISEFVGKVVPLAKEVVWAVDQPGGSAALLLALLWERGQGVLYVPGLSVNRASDAYRGESKTDARDARDIADQARMRSDLSELEPGEEELAELGIVKMGHLGDV